MANKRVDVDSVFEQQFASKYDTEKNETKGVRIGADGEEERAGKQKKNNKQKTFYLPDDTIATVRRIAFERNCDQSGVVNEALKKYFESEGY